VVRKKEKPVMMQSPSSDANPVAIKVIGVGGAGCNAINRMIAGRMEQVEFIAVNTDNQALLDSPAALKIRIGDKVTRGLGAGGDPSIGQQAAEESAEDLQRALTGADLIFVAAGMGGGTGTGAAPVVARIARELGALTVGVISMPFSFEGSRRRRTAVEGAATLKEQVDTLITVPNDRLVLLGGKRMTASMAFSLADEILRAGIQGISDTILIPGLINLDFADVKSVLSSSGSALMAIGRAAGDGRAAAAAHHAIASPLLDVSIDGARGILFTVTGSDYTLFEVGEAAAIIQDAADPDANIIFGAVIDETMGDEVQITVIATGFEGRPREQPQGWQGEVARAEPTRSQPTPPRASRSSVPATDPLDVPAFQRTRPSGP
jgi:cell division protein FtsZ